MECGFLLAKQGYNVCILEKNSQIGGCLQTFKRGTDTFDTGFHYVGGLDEGQPLHTLFGHFDLLDLPWQRLDEEAFAEVVLDGTFYRLASGYEHFIETLAEDFPRHREELVRYVELLKEVGRNITDPFHPRKQEGNTVSGFFERSAYDFLQETISNKTLRNVLSGASLTMELSPVLPLYIFAQINHSFIQSSWRLKGGGSRIAQRLADNIIRMGGTIITNACVNKLIEDNGRITAVEYNGEERMTARYVISDLHPASTLSLIEESRLIRPIYRRRITALPNTYGMFTTHLQLKPDRVPYLNRNLFLYRGKDLWNNTYTPNRPVDKVLVSYQVPEQGCYTRNIDLLTPMYWEEVAEWADTTIGRRGEAYKDFKARKAEECIALATGRLPELNGNIERIYTSSPLTYRDYTGTIQGSAYGIRKDCNNVMLTLPAPSTPIPNLLMTGQNLNLHGILGVSMTALMTCGKIASSE